MPAKSASLLFTVALALGGAAAHPSAPACMTEGQPCGALIKASFGYDCCDNSMCDMIAGHGHGLGKCVAKAPKTGNMKTGVPTTWSLIEGQQREAFAFSPENITETYFVGSTFTDQKCKSEISRFAEITNECIVAGTVSTKLICSKFGKCVSAAYKSDDCSGEPDSLGTKFSADGSCRPAHKKSPNMGQLYEMVQIVSKADLRVGTPRIESFSSKCEGSALVVTDMSHCTPIGTQKGEGSMRYTCSNDASHNVLLNIWDNSTECMGKPDRTIPGREEAGKCMHEQNAARFGQYARLVCPQYGEVKKEDSATLGANRFTCGMCKQLLPYVKGRICKNKCAAMWPFLQGTCESLCKSLCKYAPTAACWEAGYCPKP
jgi:hypothetical protein